VWNLLHATPLAPELRWFLYFWNICTPLPYDKWWRVQMMELILVASFSFSQSAAFFLTQSTTQSEQLKSNYGTWGDYKYLRVIEMASSGGAMFSEYVTHKSRLQIAVFHKPCGVVNHYKRRKPVLETICNIRATPCHWTLLVCECQMENVPNSVQNYGVKCSTCYGYAFFMTETLSLVLILIYCPHKSLSH
jgi:hypothetical protein